VQVGIRYSFNGTNGNVMLGSAGALAYPQVLPSPVQALQWQCPSRASLDPKLCAWRRTDFLSGFSESPTSHGSLVQLVFEARSCSVSYPVHTGHVTTSESFSSNGRPPAGICRLHDEGGEETVLAAPGKPPAQWLTLNSERQPPMERTELL